MKKILALILALALVLGLATFAFAADLDGDGVEDPVVTEEPNDPTPSADPDPSAPPAEVEEDAVTITLKKDGTNYDPDAVTYTYYKIFDAAYTEWMTEQEPGDYGDVGATQEKKEGVAYTIPVGSPLVTVANDGTASIAGLEDYIKLTKSTDGTLYVVEYLKDDLKASDAEAMAAVLQGLVEGLSENDLAKIETGTLTYADGEYTATVSKGYYLIVSDLGKNLVLATTDIEINEKNEYIVDEKMAETASVTIGENVTYYIRVNIPANVNLEKLITVHDQMDAELKFNNDVQLYIADEDPTPAKGENQSEAEYAAAKKEAYKALTYGDLTDNFAVVTENLDDDCTFHIDINPGKADATAQLASLAGKTAIFKFTAELLSTADADGDGYVNTEYVNQDDFGTEPSTPVVYTYDFDVLKYTMEGEKKVTLTGEKAATFEMYQVITTTEGEGDEATTTESLSDAIAFIEVDGGYKKADTDDKNTVTEIKAGEINIAGFGAGKYQLVETEAPAGYNKLTSPIVIEIADDGTITATIGEGETAVKFEQEDGEITIEVLNQAGTQLPSTGGIGTTIFYIVGSMMAVGAGIVLVTKKRLGVEA